MENRRIIISDDGIVVIPDEVKMNIGEIADLFGIYYRTAKQHIRTVEKSGIATGDDMMNASVEGKNIYPDYYGMEMIIALSFRIQSRNAEVFRKWLTRRASAKALDVKVFLCRDWNRISLN